MASGQPQQVSISDLDLQQLADVKRQLDDELKHLTNSFAQLKQAQAKFKACIENLSAVKPENSGKTILVPLTNSLYVPGKLCDTENVIVDIGTGYYVQKSRPQALKHYDSKVEYIGSNLEKLQDTIQKKQDNVNIVANVVQAKLQAQTQASASESGPGS